MGPVAQEEPGALWELDDEWAQRIDRAADSKSPVEVTAWCAHVRAEVSQWEAAHRPWKAKPWVVVHAFSGPRRRCDFAECLLYL